MEEKKVKKRKKIATEDLRFARVKSDPRFDVLPIRKRKVVVDERFKGLLNDKRFDTGTNIDIRGRKFDVNKKCNLKQLYELDTEQSPASPSALAKDDTEFEKEKEIKLDLARGDGNISSSDEDSSSDWDLIEDEGEEHCWGELDRDARRVEWASRRLALCNMEWDRITATDIYVLLSSFKPPLPAAILSVTIYLSDFGKERLEEEEKIGPKLRNLTNSIDDGDEMDSKTREALRAYQLDTMRYYYAIIDCDSERTASAIYESCDGVEFESSAIRMDLRFVPDEMTFEGAVIKDIATEDTVNINLFKPKNFESAALSKSSSKLTWDETNPERLKALRESFDQNADLDQFQDLIAPASSDDEATDTNNIEHLLQRSDVRKENDRCNVDVTWESGLQFPEEAVKKDTKGANPTPWEKFLEKRKAKRKERKTRSAELRKKKKLEYLNSFLPSNNSTSKTLVCEGSEKELIAEEINDERFAALYSNSAFAIDQSNPLYKSTSLIMQQVSEKQKLNRLRSNDVSGLTLVEKIKRKTKKKMKIINDKN